MNILVCVRQIETSASAPGHPAGGYAMNGYDACALEEALVIRETTERAADSPPFRIDVVTAGPERAAEVLKRAVGMGADRGFHVRVPEAVLADPFVTGSLLAGFARPRAYDLILTGILSEDTQQGQVGPVMAERLSLPFAAGVVRCALFLQERILRVEREIEGGDREAVELDLPALISIQSGIRTPRYPTLSRMLRAVRQQPETLRPAHAEIPDPRQIVTGTAPPRKVRAGRLLSGAPEEKALELVALFRQWGLIH